jgi:hypothetical protein
MHELQHAIQDKEGWARGGSPDSMLAESLPSHVLDYIAKNKVLATKLDNAGNHTEAQALRKKLNDIAKAEATPELRHKAYRRLTGEAQARATQDRLPMDAQQRRDSYPLAGGKLSDIPLNKLINRYGEGGPSMSIKPTPETEFSRAHKEAQRNAALPVEEGGLGLPADNTAMDRAAIMYPIEAYHGTKSGSITDINPLMLGHATQAQSAKQAFFSAKTPETANSYSALEPRNNNFLGDEISKQWHEIDKKIITEYENLDDTYRYDFEGNNYDEFLKTPQAKEIKNKIDELKKDRELVYQQGGSIYPLRLNLGNKLEHDYQGEKYRDESYSDILKNSSGYDSVVFKNSIDSAKTSKPEITDIYAVKDPKNIRSRFAAFDPKNKNSANILASILAGTTLASQHKKDKRK